MPDFAKDLLLDVPAYPEAGFARLADRLGAVLRTADDVLLVQGEAIVALEAVATQASTAIESARLYREAVEKRALERELGLAAEMQRALLPEARQTGRHFDVAARAKCVAA